MTFVHLHTHTQYSLLDGASRIDKLVERAVRLNQPAVSVTDHGSLSGAFQLWRECSDNDVRETTIKPIIGCEFYVAPGSRGVSSPVFWGLEDQRRRDVSGQGAYTHLSVIARDADGIRSLYRLQSEAYRTGFYRKPRIDISLLEQQAMGLIVLSGCAGGELATKLRLGLKKEAYEYAYQMYSIFGDRFFIEVMHHGIKTDELDEDELNEQLYALADDLDIRTVATGDCHYCDPEDASVHDAMLCLQTRSRLADEKRMRFNGEGFYLKSREEMEQLPLRKESLDNTLLIAEMVGSYDEVFEHRLRMPKPINDNSLREEVFYSDRFRSSDIARIEYELDVIESMGYDGYFLVLKECLDAGRAAGIRIGPGRGSGGGSLVAYTLGIHDLDPIEHGLLFERFLNPGRKSLPDIDIDIDDSRRSEFLQLVREKYGEDHVASIGTFGTIGARKAIQDSVFVRGEPYSLGERLKGLLPPNVFGRSPSLSSVFSPDESLSLSLAFGLEGLIREEGVHAGGIIICPEKLSSIVPLRGREVQATGYDMHEVEQLGLVKIDFLGLKNLGVIDECLRMCQARGLNPELPTVLDGFRDAATFRLLSSGHASGVFQLDSPGMRGLLRKLRPNSLDDIAAVLALYRPGPMGVNAHTRYAERGSNSIHPELDGPLEGILGDTYGLIVFQEQVMAVLAKIAGWGYTEAGLLFDAMRKKNHEKMAQSRPLFYAAASARGYSDSALDALWDTLVPFADYSFNKSHAVGYAYISYWTAYLKANHPLEYMAALLSAEDDPDKLWEYIHEAKRMGIALLPPDVNQSHESWTPTDGGLRFGLSAIKGVGPNISKAVARGRPYASLHDFFARVGVGALNVGSLSALARVGSFDSLWPDREGLVVSMPLLTEQAARDRKRKKKGERGVIRVKYQPKVSDSVINYEERASWEMAGLGVALSAPICQIVIPKKADLGYLMWLKDALPKGDQTVILLITGTSVQVHVKSRMNPELESAIVGSGGEVRYE